MIAIAILPETQGVEQCRNKYPQKKHDGHFGNYPHVEMCLSVWIIVVYGELIGKERDFIHMWIVQ